MLDKNFKSINNARGFFASQSTQGDNGDEIKVHTKKNVMEISPKDFKHLLCENKFISIMMIFLRPESRDKLYGVSFLLISSSHRVHGKNAGLTWFLQRDPNVFCCCESRSNEDIFQTSLFFNPRQRLVCNRSNPLLGVTDILVALHCLLFPAFLCESATTFFSFFPRTWFFFALEKWSTTGKRYSLVVKLKHPTDNAQRYVHQYHSSQQVLSNGIVNEWG